MLVGHNAELALESAKILDRWEQMEADGLVKIEAVYDDDPDPSFYDTWEHLSERSKEQLKQRYCEDCYIVQTYYRADAEFDWQWADSIGGCSGYNDPTSPFENCYVIDLMESAINQLEKDTLPGLIDQQAEAAYSI